jgi:cytoplasmic iron level regulating protein YaaA (DUF328/UPF0246 family)
MTQIGHWGWAPWKDESSGHRRFRKTMAYAKRLKPESIFILSAKYGLLSPSHIIEPYERTLKAMKAGERRTWAKGVIKELRKHADLDNDHFVFLAGADYRQNLIPHLKRCSVPMASAW